MQINFHKLHFSSCHFSSKKQKTKVSQKKKKEKEKKFTIPQLFKPNQTLRVKIKISSITYFLISFIFLITDFLTPNQTHP